VAQIQAENLTKKFKIYDKGNGLKGYLKSIFSREYNEITAVDSLDLEVDEGEIIGYIGSNGAGKSTTVKMLTGIMEPSDGSVHVKGRNPSQNRKQNAKDIGVVFGQKTQLWWDLPVGDSFRLLKKIYEISDEEYESRMDRFDSVLQIRQFTDKPVRKLSLGQKMRCELAAAFIHDPDIVYLDEPTIGLDVAVKERIRNFIRSMNEDENTTVMLTTHDIGDINDLCNRVVVMDEGEKIFDGAIDKLVNRFDSRKLLLEISEKQAQNIQIDGIVEKEFNNGEVLLTFNREETSAADLMRKILEEYEVTDFKVKEPDMEEVVKKIYNEGL
jgi:ABC-2 type transport system ATP-binding protein